MIKTKSIAKFIRKNQALKGELIAIDVAVQLSVLVADSGLSRAQLATKLGYSQSRISQILSGNENLTCSTVNAFAAALGKKLSFLFENSKTQNNIDSLDVTFATNIFSIKSANLYVSNSSWEDLASSSPQNSLIGRLSANTSPSKIKLVSRAA